MYGHLGGRPKRKAPDEDEEPQGAAPGRFLKESLDPQKHEVGAASVKKLQDFVHAKLKEKGLEPKDLTSAFMSDLQVKYFKGQKTRRLMQLYNDKGKKAQLVEELEIGKGGGRRKSGEHGLTRASRQHMGLGVRVQNEEQRTKKSAVWQVLHQVRDVFRKWRMSGQYVDREDIQVEFEAKLQAKVTELEAKRKQDGNLSIANNKVLIAAKKRIAGHKKNPKNRVNSMDQMQRLFGAKLLRPQRLIHIGLSEEKKRVHDSWWFYDWTMWLACFAPLEELGNHVTNPKLYRDNVRKTVLSHSDQMPFFVKLKPGKQMYLPEEVKDMRKPLSKDEVELKYSNAGSQKKEGLLRDFADEGMSQLRGESHGNQDKFRITVDLEQVIYNYFEDADVVPVADFGITSVILTGKHYNDSNVDNQRCYIADEKFCRDGIEVNHIAGTRVEAGLGNQIQDFRENHPELYAEMIELGFRFYQQPAGFEDALITCWKIQAQLKVHGQNMALRDLFTGALSTFARLESHLCQQLAAWIRSKVTAIMQTADCIVIRPVKLKSAEKDIQLRKELIQLAELENTRAVFKCGVYETMRKLYEVIKECREEFRQDQRLLKGIYSLGWLCVRPNLKTGKMVDCRNQDWCKGWKLGSHRIQKSWLEERLAHLDKDGVPRPDFQDKDENGFTEDCDQTYMVEKTDKRSLAVWKEMLEKGEIDDEQIKEFSEEPWFEMEVSTFQNFKGLEQYGELMKTPAQQRRERGIDPGLTSQRTDKERQRRLKRKRELKKIAREPLRQEAVKEMRRLRAAGYSIEQVSAHMIVPQLGKGRKTAKKFRDAVAQQLKKKKKAAPAAAEGKEKDA